MEYLSILNKMAACSYPNLMQYPAMSFVLVCYNTVKLDLNQYQNKSKLEDNFFVLIFIIIIYYVLSVFELFY